MSRTARTEARAPVVHLRPAVLGAVVLIGLATAFGLTRALAQSAEGYDDALRAFDTRTGRALTSIDLSPVQPIFTNDLTFGPDGDIYITDTGFRGKADGTLEHTGPDRMYRIGRDRRVTVALDTSALNAPDGIDWDAKGKRMVLAPIGGPALQIWNLGQPAPVDLKPGPGRFDGIEVEQDGNAYITSRADSSISVLRGTELVRFIGPLDAPPADVSVDARHGRIGVVFLTANRFELWTLR